MLKMRGLQKLKEGNTKLIIIKKKIDFLYLCPPPDLQHDLYAPSTVNIPQQGQERHLVRLRTHDGLNEDFHNAADTSV